MMTRHPLRSVALGAALMLGLGVLAPVSTVARAAPTPEKVYDSVLNGSFEADAGWSSFAEQADTAGTVSTDQSHHGVRSLRLEDGSNASAVGWISNAVRVNAGKQYVLTAQSYVESGHPPMLYLRFYDAAGQQVGNESTSASSRRGEWSNLRLAAHAPVGATHAKVIAYSIRTRVGVSFFDAIDLAPADQESLVSNQYFYLQQDNNTPWGWYDLDDTPGASAVVADPTNSINGVLAVTATKEGSKGKGKSWSGAAGTRFDASAGTRYVMELDALRQQGTPAMQAVIRYYDKSGSVLGQDETSIDVTHGTWRGVGLSSLAPTGAVAGELVLGCAGSTRCDTLVDNVKINASWDRTFHAGPAAQGTGDGTAEEDTADYRDEAFWDQVRAALETGSVKVELADGQYAVSSNDDALPLRNIGSSAHRLLVSGESRYGVVFTQRAALSTYVVHVRNAVNVTVENFHLTADGRHATASAFLVQVDRPAGEQTSGIAVQHFSIADMPGVKYSGVGVASTSVGGPGVEDVTITDGLFVRNGYSSGYHHVYATRGSSHVTLSGSVLQDSSGTYLKLRDNTADWTVQDNVFLSTGTWVNQVPFVQFALYNTTDPGTEFFSAGPYRFVGNVFEAKDAWCADCYVFNVTTRGYNPVDDDGVEWDHLLDPVKRSVLLDESEANIETRREMMRQNFNLAFDDPDGIFVSDNEYRHMDTMARLWTKADFGAPTQGGDGIYDLSNLFATYRDGF